jgi:hypothetical protein
MSNKRYMYTILKNTNGKYWLWFDEIGKMVDGVYVPNLQPYHEIETTAILQEGAKIWTEDLMSVPEMCQLRPLGEYSANYVVKARIRNEAKYLARPAAIPPPPSTGGKTPGHD